MLTGLAAAGVSAGAGIIGNLLGNKSQKDVNKANLQINKMNNEFNERMLDKQNQWNLEQWERETAYNDQVRAETNEYNSARAQVERYRQAGLNPAIMMQGQGAGTSQGGSAPQARSGSASASPSAAMQAYRPDMSFVGDMTNYLFQANSMAEDVKSKELDNKLKEQSLDSQIQKFLHDMETSKLDKEIKHIFRSKYEDILNGQIKLTDTQARQADMNANLLKTEELLKSKELYTFEQKFGEESALRVAQKVLWVESANLSRNQARESIAREVLLVAQVAGQKISNQQAYDLADHLLEKTRNEAKWSRYAPSAIINMQHSQVGFDKYIRESSEKFQEAWKRYIYKPWIRPLRRGLGF